MTSTQQPERARARLEQLWSNQYSSVLDNKFDQFYLRNPAGQARLWLLYRQGEPDPIGSAAVFPRKLIVKGEIVCAGIAGDLFVSREHRTAGPATLLLRQAVSAVDDGELDLVYAVPNHAAEPLFRRLGYRSVSRRVRWLMVLDSRSYLSRLPRAGFWVRAAGVALQARLRRRPWSGSRPAGATVTTDAAIDDRFDSFWKRAQGSFDVFGDRSSSYLNWRFKLQRGSGHKVLTYQASDHALLGYAVVRKDGARLEIRDLVWDKGVRPAPLLAAVSEYGRTLGCDAVQFTVVERPDLGNWLPQLGFVKRAQATRLYVYARPDVWSRFPWLSDTTSWLFCSGDEDT